MNVAAGSSPVSVARPDGSVVVFKRDTDGALWELATGGTPKRLGNGLGMAVGTSPAAAAVGGSVVTAFQASGSGNLWYVSDGEGQGHDTGIKMAAGTSPSITAKPSGSGLEIVFTAASDGLLYRLDPGFDLRYVANGLGVAPGTSPVIAAPVNAYGKFEIAFQAAGSGNLWYVDEDNVGHDTGIKMAPGTSPGIAVQPGGSHYVIVFKKNADNMLWEFGPYYLRYAANGLGVAPNTSPVVATMADGSYAIAFNAAVTNDLWTVDANNVGRDTGVSMQPGTSPSINSNCDDCEIIY
jgi:hypothetical protein